MMEQKNTDPVERACILLGLESVDAKDANIELLLQGLLDKRPGCHPDNFTDPKAQAIATKQFQEIQELIAQLEMLRQRSIIKRGETNLTDTTAPETLSYRIQLNATEEEVRNLKDEVQKLRKKCQSLEAELKAEHDSRRDKELARIRELYKPSKGHILGTTLTVLLASVLAILSQIEKIGTSLERLLPTSSEINRVIFFWVAIAVIVVTLLKFLKNFEFKTMMGGVCTTSFASRFFSYVTRSRYWDDFDDDEHQKPVRFSEDQIVNFLSVAFKVIPYDRNSKDKRTKGSFSSAQEFYRRIVSFLRNPRRLYRRTLGLCSDETFDNLKDAFIYKLIERRLVADPRPNGLMHMFEARSEPHE